MLTMLSTMFSACNEHMHWLAYPYVVCTNSQSEYEVIITRYTWVFDRTPHTSTEG